MFHLTYSFDILKKVIERIVHQSDSQSDKIHQSLSDLISHANTNDTKISDLQRQMLSLQKSVDQKLNNVAKLCSDNETALLDHKQHITDLHNKFNEFKASIPAKYDDTMISKRLEEIENVSK